jgi:NAD(P)-dependent dehydrogenase (short-subunit alcohol dehydrogenase family)
MPNTNVEASPAASALRLGPTTGATRPALRLAREKIATTIMAVAFLASSKAAYINGESLTIDGDWIA